MVTAGSFERLRDKGRCLVEVGMLRCWLWWAGNVELHFQNPLHGYLRATAMGPVSTAHCSGSSSSVLQQGRALCFQGEEGIVKLAAGKDAIG